MRDCGLQGVKAVVERQKRMPTEGNDDGFLFDTEHIRGRRLGSHRRVGRRRAALPFGDRLGIDPIAPGQRSYALLTTLYRSTHRLCRAGAPVKYLAHSSSLSIETESGPSYPGTKNLG